VVGAVLVLTRWGHRASALLRKLGYASADIPRPRPKSSHERLAAKKGK